MPLNVNQRIFLVHVGIFTFLGVVTLFLAIIDQNAFSEYVHALILITSGIISFATYKKSFTFANKLHLISVFAIICRILFQVYDGNPGAPIQTLAALYLTTLAIYLGRVKTALFMGTVYTLLMIFRLWMLKNNPSHFFYVELSPLDTFLYLIVLCFGLFSFSIYINTHLENQLKSHFENTAKLEQRRNQIAIFEHQISQSITSIEKFSLANSHDIRGPLSKIMTILVFWETDGSSWTLSDYESFNTELTDSLDQLEKRLIIVEQELSDELEILQHFEIFEYPA